MRMMTDAKTLKEAVEQQETLTRELSHRMKNLLTITGSIVTMTARLLLSCWPIR
jgi:two-component sensor histidine kinase